eukprot:m.89409 g.89409  ORF g.89409 m.89409 type:complete len:278 (+) comp9803_c0_seq3:92-925(+)
MRGGKESASELPTSPPAPVLLASNPTSPRRLSVGSAAAMDTASNSAIKMTFKLGKASPGRTNGNVKGSSASKAKSPRSSTGAGKSRQSSPSKSPTKSPTKSNGVGGSAGRKSPTKSRTPKSAQGRRSPTKAKSRRNSSVSDAGDSAREKRMFPLDRVREIMREHAGVNRSLSLESQNTMAYAAEQFVYYIAKESLARTGSKSKKNREIDYDSVARAVEDVPTLQAFLSEIVPPRMTFGECEALNAREKEQAAAAAANARANDETNGDDAAEGDDDDD